MTTFKSRVDVPDQEKWDLTDIYQTIQDWQNDYQKVETFVDDLKTFNGNIHDSHSLLSYLTKREEISRLFSLIYAYARLQSDLDTRDTKAQSLLDKASQLHVKISAASSFFSPFLLSIEEKTLHSYIEENEGLQYYKEDLLELYRYKKHVLNKDKEEILSQMGEALSSPQHTYGMLNNADIVFGTVTADDEKKVPLTRGMYAKLIKDEDRDKRKEAYKAYYQPYIQLKNSIASTLSAAIKNNITISKIRNYPSALEKSLFDDNVPKEVYDNLIQTTKQNIASLHTYNNLRKEKLQLDELRQYDLHVDLVEGVKQDISYEEAFETMLASLSPLGEEYIQTLRSFKDKRYIDVRELPGKRSGAYNFGSYDVHPFILLNHNDDLNSLFTLTHECGHGMHTHYSHSFQPRISAHYSIFVAEVASTVNEVLLIHHLLKEAKDIDVRNHLINHFIEKFKGTFFTQVMFAEFEKITHEMAQEGKPLNAQSFNEVYETLFREYNGEAVIFDEEVKYGWARIPHFYRPFYVYKYATGFASAIQIAEQLLSGDPLSQQNYIAFLKSGSSDYPLQLLQKTGVDLTTPKPIESALERFKKLVEEFSTL
ncbi:oligoendopeptidase F [Bacillus cytotoxicus]|uniref:Oligopeptidase F n=1 Tax=Bacillus cytotoxicus (strain DSM 22905 / CIP 110041 / 391-98 / NVH 391-98) TaxID=315749 RepID=A7GQP3_BACCN|nr:oligoendopeptidase F [Bacillus cytotoxicus]ABS22451.1 oligoendopeptidase F [Bacillus cytotoxicus NVH 391-98]AWC45105.1 oligoendopeptidase F [Bacillus cytotoxicus]MDH2865454.1 oligoendopeptidase F [Bacillus cytotoxicus]MDH2885309.1 oligoendopeptidase F [Bacillus cytotoxicus]NZD33722.1 oligoendopeptidase F [Bacillus cytotoxicus]